MESTFSVFKHVKRWRVKNKTFRQIKIILLPNFSLHSYWENAYQHFIVLFRNREVGGVKKIEAGSASVSETIKTTEVIQKRAVKPTSNCYFPLVKISYSFTCENIIFIRFEYTLTACNKIKLWIFIYGRLSISSQRTFYICRDRCLWRSRQI